MPTIYQPSSLLHTIIALIFYITMAGFVIYSIIALYSLIRFGKSKSLALMITALYTIIASGLYASAVINLNNLKF